MEEGEEMCGEYRCASFFFLSLSLSLSLSPAHYLKGKGKEQLQYKEERLITTYAKLGYPVIRILATLIYSSYPSSPSSSSSSSSLSS